MAIDSHDHFVKHWLAHPDAARDLRVFLPKDLAESIQWAGLTDVPTVTVDAQGVELRSDVVLALPTVDSPPLWLHLHVEHQRRVDPWMALRILEYQARLWRRHTRQTETTSLPAIVSVVLYNGKTQWTAATSLHDLVDRPGNEVRTECRYQLVNVRDFAESDDLGPGFRLGLRLLREADDAQLWQRVASWGELLYEVSQLQAGLERLLGAFTYIGRLVGEPSAETLRTLRNHLPRDIQEGMLTWEQSIERRGEARGLREALVTLLGTRFGPLSSDTATRLERASTDELERWVQRFAQGINSIDELWSEA